VPVTLRDVARKCGLSPSTVSDVLNHRSRTWASDETRQRIFAAAEQLGYRPNSAARALRTGKTFTVAFVYHRDWSELPVTFDGSAEIMASHLGEHGYDLRLHVYPNQAQLIEGIEDVVRRRTCDAIVIFGRESHVAEQGKVLEKYQIPFVVKGRHEKEHPKWYQVDYDHEGMMRSVVRHLVNYGRKRIAYIGHAYTEVYQSYLFAGFRDEHMNLLGKPPAEDFIFLVRQSVETVKDRLQQWFSLPSDQQPDALAIGTSDAEWREIEQFLAQQGRRIGYGEGDIAVCGQATHCLYLSFGEAHFFADISHASIAQVLVQDLLIPILGGKEVHSRVCRILPPLQPMGTLGISLPSQR